MRKLHVSHARTEHARADASALVISLWGGLGRYPSCPRYWDSLILTGGFCRRLLPLVFRSEGFTSRGEA